ncbi:arginase family protein [Microbacterium indicum]|uniref:arginase family protein n=1 Tax=Microbacterium indicum TaxID=358100 RepID=UPI000412CF5E|nr:arginase family protein [Microbacterium indicum]
MTRFVVAPQWQGSPSTRAMALIDGADAISGDLPSSACVRVEVPYEAGEALGTGVARASTLQRVRSHILDALEVARGERVVTVGGDCGVAVPAIEHVAGEDLAVVWFDAHGDLHTPETSPSGAFGGMALRSVLGSPAAGLEIPAGRILPERVILAGARAFDDAEAEFLGASPLVRADDRTVVEAVRRSGASRLYVHVDLDVLDPAELAGVSDAQPFGMTAAGLLEAIAGLREALPLVGASVAGFAPRSPEAAVDDMGTILRIIGALARG